MSETAVAESRPSPSPEILDMSDLAKLLRISYSKLRAIRAAGGGPPPTYMAGTRPRWTIAAVNAWLAKQDQMAASEKKGRR